MNGGLFDYKQSDIHELMRLIVNALSLEEGIVQNKMINSLLYLGIAYTFVQRIDWHLSGDDSEKTFLARLDEELTPYREVIWDKFYNNLDEKVRELQGRKVLPMSDGEVDVIIKYLPHIKEVLTKSI